MKKILGVSLVALMAVSTARAEIASKAYVDNNFQATSAIVESISSSSTHAQYPTAKAVWDSISTAGGNYDPAGTGASEAAAAVGALDLAADAATGNGNVVTQVTQEDGQIAVVKGITALQQSDVAQTYDASGTAPVSGAAVASAISSAAGNYDAAGTAAGLIEGLDGGTISGSGVVTAISQADGQVSATLSQITNTEVASNAAIDLSKIAMPSLSTLSTTGTVVLTAKAGTGEQAGQVVYAWETIQR